MRLLLLGCTGFVGKELVPALIKEGHELCIISRKNINNLKINIPLDKFNFLKIDLSKKQNWSNENLLKILNCLLYTSPSPRDGLLSRMPSSA